MTRSVRVGWLGSDAQGVAMVVRCIDGIDGDAGCRYGGDAAHDSARVAGRCSAIVGVGHRQ